MRRPLKPFVTEYRGGARRQAGAASGGQGQDAKLDAEGSEPRAPEPWPAQSRSLAPTQEDGYEAALRAADALFAARRRDPEAGTAAVPQDGEPGSPPAPGSSPSGGRILRAIDEPPPPELLRLEAEFAPKRRGRKPGSKNKPKLPAPVVEAAVAVAAEPVAIERSPFQAMERAVTYPASIPFPASVPLQAGGVAGPRGERYAWVRTKLKPGQQWKRRLPKVAW